MKKIIYLVLSSTLLLNACSFNGDNDDSEDNVSVAKPESTLPSEASDKITQLMKNNHYSGSVYINYKNKEYKNSFGYRSIDKKVKNDKNSMYLIGSANKFLTAMMIKKLEQEKKIASSDKVMKYIPDFPSEKATILDLILHKSGLIMYEPEQNNNSLDASIKQINRNGLDQNIVDKYNYNDANYIVLARIIEKVTKKSYEDNLEKYLTKPYKLNNTGTAKNTKLEKYFTEGIQFKNNEKQAVKPINVNAYYGAGDLYMSPIDYGHLVNAFKTNKLFDQKTTEEMLNYSTIKQKYRYGLHVMDGFYRMRGYFFGQDLLCWFNKDYTIVIATNKIGAKGDLSNERLMKEIRQIVVK